MDIRADFEQTIVDNKVIMTPPVYFSGFLFWGVSWTSWGTRFQVGTTGADQRICGLMNKAVSA